MWGEFISQSVNSVLPLGKHNSPIFPKFPQNFPPISGKILGKFRGILANSGKIPGILGKFRGILANSGKIQGNLGEFWGNQTESFSLVFTRFHSFSQVRTTFPSWENLILLISPVATVKTGENSGEKKWKGIRRETWICFHFISPSLHPPSPPPRPVSIAQYCSLINLQRGVINLQWEV